MWETAADASFQTYLQLVLSGPEETSGTNAPRLRGVRTPEIHYVFKGSLALNTFGYSNTADNLNDASSSTCYYHRL